MNKLEYPEVSLYKLILYNRQNQNYIFAKRKVQFSEFFVRLFKWRLIANQTPFN